MTLGEIFRPRQMLKELYFRSQYERLAYYYRNYEDGNTKIELNRTLLKFTENNISQHV